MDAVERLEKENARLRAEVRRLESYRATTFKDHVTGLSNRRYFEDRLHQELARAKRWNWSCSILVMDIDRFKEINETYGPTTGDEILVFIARFLERGVREIDIPCRVGGSEFAIILPYTDQRGTEVVSHRLSVWLREEDAPQGVSLFMSVGCATFPTEASTLTELLDAADDALYLDKRRKHAASEVQARGEAAHIRSAP